MLFCRLVNKTRPLLIAPRQLFRISKYSVSRTIIPSFPSMKIRFLNGSYTPQRGSSQDNLSELTVDFDYVKSATKKDDTLIIDVREPEEVKESGHIPNSINIPLGSVVAVLSTVTDKEFKEIFDRQRPSDNTEIIFYCMIGKRSGKAQKDALSLGFKNAKNYLGSWTDWASKTK